MATLKWAKKMSVETWGTMPKAQDDDETIDEAIVRLISAHNDASDSHLGAGGSLQSHAASEVIDHLADSIITDKLLDNAVSYEKLLSASMYVLNLNYESWDKWVFNVGDGGDDIGCIFLQTGNIINTVREGYPNVAVGPESNKACVWSVPFRFGQTTSQLGYVACGFNELGGECIGFGFKVSNSSLYALRVEMVGGVYTEYTTLISGVAVNCLHIYRIEYNGSNEIKFYVDGVLVATHSGISFGSYYSMNTPLYVYIKNTTGANKTLDVYPLYFQRSP